MPVAVIDPTSNSEHHMTARKHRPTKGFFDADDLLERIRKTDHPLFRLRDSIQWDVFKPIIDRVFFREPKGPGGRPAFDRLFMFRVAVLQHLYNLSDPMMEQKLLADLHFRLFLDLTFADPTPDEKTIWLYRECLNEAGIIFELFELFDAQLLAKGLIAKDGIIVDATIVPAPKQHFSGKEKEALKQGDTPESWKDKPARGRQKDIDADWTKKRNQTYFGYKNHIKIDRGSKLIRTFEVTPANDHDSQLLGTLITEEDAGQELHGDSAYTGKPIQKQLRRNKIKDRIHRKAMKNKPLSRYQEKNNRKKSVIRARVEHVFGDMRGQMNDIRIRSRGLLRATFALGMRNLVYNMRRMEIIVRMAKA